MPFDRYQVMVINGGPEVARLMREGRFQRIPTECPFCFKQSVGGMLCGECHATARRRLAAIVGTPPREAAAKL